MKVVFVCTGNTCRSPMAEAMWRYLMKDVTDDSHTVHSAGLAPAIGLGGEIPDPFGGDASLYAQCASSIWEHLAAAKQRLYPEHGDTK